MVFEGTVSEERLTELYGRTRLSLAPLTYGAGLKGKVVEALSWGHRVIGSAYAFEGLEEGVWAAPAVASRCCHRPEEFAAAVREGLVMAPSEVEALERDCQAFIERCFSAEAQQQALWELLQPVLVPQPAATGARGWPDGLRGGEATGLMLLSSSHGLSQDGWLELDNQLVVQLRDRPSINQLLQVGLYLPEGGNIEGESALQITLGDGNAAWGRVQIAMRRGLNVKRFVIPAGFGKLATLKFESFYRFIPAGGTDQRDLLAVLSELSLIHEGKE